MGSTGPIFNKLHAKLVLQLKGGGWMKILSFSARDAKIDSIIKALGTSLNEIENETYDDILLGDGGEKMKEIAAILMGE